VRRGWSITSRCPANPSSSVRETRVEKLCKTSNESWRCTNAFLVAPSNDEVMNPLVTSMK
jgi:hypothetical protein